MSAVVPAGSIPKGLSASGPGQDIGSSVPRKRGRQPGSKNKPKTSDSPQIPSFLEVTVPSVPPTALSTETRDIQQKYDEPTIDPLPITNPQRSSSSREGGPFEAPEDAAHYEKAPMFIEGLSRGLTCKYFMVNSWEIVVKHQSTWCMPLLRDLLPPKTQLFYCAYFEGTGGKQSLSAMLVKQRATMKLQAHSSSVVRFVREDDVPMSSLDASERHKYNFDFNASGLEWEEVMIGMMQFNDLVTDDTTYHKADITSTMMVDRPRGVKMFLYSGMEVSMSHLMHTMTYNAIYKGPYKLNIGSSSSGLFKRYLTMAPSLSAAMKSCIEVPFKRITASSQGKGITNNYFSMRPADMWFDENSKYTSLQDEMPPRISLAINYAEGQSHLGPIYDTPYLYSVIFAYPAYEKQLLVLAHEINMVFSQLVFALGRGSKMSKETTEERKTSRRRNYGIMKTNVLKRLGEDDFPGTTHEQKVVIHNCLIQNAIVCMLDISTGASKNRNQMYLDYGEYYWQWLGSGEGMPVKEPLLIGVPMDQDDYVDLQQAFAAVHKFEKHHFKKAFVYLARILQRRRGIIEDQVWQENVDYLLSLAESKKDKDELSATATGTRTADETDLISTIRSNLASFATSPPVPLPSPSVVEEAVHIATSLSVKDRVAMEMPSDVPLTNASLDSITEMVVEVVNEYTDVTQISGSKRSRDEDEPEGSIIDQPYAKAAPGEKSSVYDVSSDMPTEELSVPSIVIDPHGWKTPPISIPTIELMDAFSSVADSKGVDVEGGFINTKGQKTRSISHTIKIRDKKKKPKSERKEGITTLTQSQVQAAAKAVEKVFSDDRIKNLQDSLSLAMAEIDHHKKTIVEKQNEVTRMVDDMEKNGRDSFAINEFTMEKDREILQLQRLVEDKNTELERQRRAFETESRVFVENHHNDINRLQTEHEAASQSLINEGKQIITSQQSIIDQGVDLVNDLKRRNLVAFKEWEETKALLARAESAADSRAQNSLKEKIREQEYQISLLQEELNVASRTHQQNKGPSTPFVPFSTYEPWDLDTVVPSRETTPSLYITPEPAGVLTTPRSMIFNFEMPPPPPPPSRPTGSQSLAKKQKK